MTSLFPQADDEIAMPRFINDDQALTWRSGPELVRIEPWGNDSLRVRATLGALSEGHGALTARPPARAVLKQEHDTATITVGAISATVDAVGHIRFLRTDNATELLAEKPIHFWWPGPRNFTATGNGYQQLEQSFAAYEEERLFGLGQHTHGRLDQKGMVLDLVQRNAEVSIPFLLSNRGYGFLWNNPALGRVELGRTATRWVSDSARQIDYWVTTGSPEQVMARYADVTGHAPMLPSWAAGFWQSKLRYRTQEELLEVAREYHRRGLPLAVIVADFFHWTQLGDWRFEPSEWPDPQAMVAELSDLGVRLMVSVWPSVGVMSSNYQPMLNAGHFIATERGAPHHADWPDRHASTRLPVAFYDASNPDARAYLWDQLYANYYRYGIKVFWLDACEPELKPGHVENLRLAAGPGREVLNRYPADHVRTIYDGMLSAGERDVVTLVRSAWAGSQQWGAFLWSGDIPATFESLATQIRAGLNVGLSGIPWWSTDIGGFHGGDPGNPEYRELIVRWFQYGVWCPLFRLHGDRLPRSPLSQAMSGGPNEVWSYGDEVYAILADILQLRERMKPYVLEQMASAAERGTPPMRPLWYDFPDDTTAWTVEDQYLFGPSVLVAPVTSLGARSRQLYLPGDGVWTDAYTHDRLGGGQWATVAAPLERIPVFLRDGAPELPSFYPPSARASGNGPVSPQN
ncbi:MAG TPA: TIM-barrel domain-containing protein [Acidimicrobiales bacterium]|nr:TIM-barrel domain-containing protein [Acidimicrobiales bacterium]